VAARTGELWQTRSRARGAVSNAVFGAVTAATAGGCAGSVSAGAAPTIDTRARVGHEERLTLAAALGGEDIRCYGAVAGGVGHLPAAESGYALVSPEIGFESGRNVVWAGGVHYSPRFFFAGDRPVAQGFGVAGEILYRLASTGGEDGWLAEGLRLSAEDVPNVDVTAPNRPGDAAAIGLFQFGVVLRWTPFDTTGRSWGFN
jgi:hypothetical protein